jgi:hypothetical protein
MLRETEMAHTAAISWARYIGVIDDSSEVVVVVLTSSVISFELSLELDYRNQKLHLNRNPSLCQLPVQMMLQIYLLTKLQLGTEQEWFCSEPPLP